MRRSRPLRVHGDRRDDYVITIPKDSVLHDGDAALQITTTSDETESVAGIGVHYSVDGGRLRRVHDPGRRFALSPAEASGLRGAVRPIEVWAGGFRAGGRIRGSVVAPFAPPTSATAERKPVMSATPRPERDFGPTPIHASQDSASTSIP